MGAPRWSGLPSWLVKGAAFLGAFLGTGLVGLWIVYTVPYPEFDCEDLTSPFGDLVMVPLVVWVFIGLSLIVGVLLWRFYRSAAVGFGCGGLAVLGWLIVLSFLGAYLCAIG